jgi:AcrR family transcriptional regulator
MTRSAALLFGERGFSGTGLRDVIAHSSTPRGSIYHHFAGVRRKKAARLATLTVTAIEGAVVVSRARGDTLALDHVGRELEAAIQAARGS